MRFALFHNLPSGGGKRAVFEWVRRLASEHTIDVFSVSTADHVFCDIRPFVSQHRVYDFEPRRTLQPPFGRLNQYQRWRDLAALDRLHHRIADDINAGSYDVLFANTCLFTFVPLLLANVQIPSVYYLHEPFGPGFVRQFDRPYVAQDSWRGVLNRYDPLIWLYRNRLEAIQRRSIGGATTLLANSRFTSQCIEAAFGRLAAICPIGVNGAEFYPAAHGRDYCVVSVGEMSPRKGFDFIVESLGTIPRHARPALRLACNMVNEDELQYVRQLAQRNEVELQVLINQDVEQLRELYSSARLCVYAPVMEPFGLVALEAMACGTPVVGVREGGIQESVVHESTGVLVERDIGKFGAAVQHLLSNPMLAAAYGRRALDHVRQRWSWERSATALASHLAQCARVTDDLRLPIASEQSRTIH